MKKAQSSTEFTILISIMLLVFVSFFAVVTYKMSDMQKEHSQKAMESLYNSIFTEISLAQEVREGYSRDFQVPTTLDGQEYQIQFIPTPNPPYGADLEITCAGQSLVKFIDGNISGTIVKGTNHITKNANVIYITS